jgi:hypothetical protein
MLNLRFEDLFISGHARQRIAERGFALSAIRDAIENPEMTYAGKDDRYPNQYRYVKGEIVVVVDTKRRSVPTVFFHGRTDYRGEHKGNQRRAG